MLRESFLLLVLWNTVSKNLVRRRRVDGRWLSCGKISVCIYWTAARRKKEGVVELGDLRRSVSCEGTESCKEKVERNKEGHKESVKLRPSKGLQEKFPDVLILEV